MVREGRIGIGFFEGMEFPVLEVAQSGRKALADQGEEGKHMVAGAARVGEVLFDVQDGVVVEQPVQNIGRLAFGRTNRQDAEVAVLIGEMAVEFGAWLAAIVQIDVAAPCSTITGPEELTVGRRGRSIAPEQSMGMTRMVSPSASISTSPSPTIGCLYCEIW